MISITDEELSALERRFRDEANLVQEYAKNAKLCTDPQLKTKFQETAAIHRAHCLALSQLLTEEEGAH